ncbi:MAG: hypothetical protein J7559_21010, partial [Cohnella sp.]|nr:hypothetical protein [Cohnella sp.]
FARAMESVSPPPPVSETERARTGLAMSPIRNKMSYTIRLRQQSVRELRLMFGWGGGRRLHGSMRVTIRDAAMREIAAFDMELAALPGDCVCAFPLPPMEGSAGPVLNIEFDAAYDKSSGYVSVFEHPLRYPILRRIGRRGALYAELD